MVMMFQSYWQKIIWFECKPSIYYYSWTPYSFFFFLIFVMIRNNVITVHVTFLFCRNISELYVSIFIVLYPDCITVVLSKCIQIGHLYIYWNVSGLSVCLSIELYPQCLFVCLTLLRRCILHLSDIIVVFLYWYKYFDLPSSCRDIIFLQFV